MFKRVLRTNAIQIGEAMPIGWYIVPYKRRLATRLPTRYCEMDDYTSEIYSYGGQWTETEVLGNVAIVKVRARQAILDALDARFQRIPRDRLDDSLAGLSQQVRTKLRNNLLDVGYMNTEIHEAFSGGLENYTLRDYFHFWARRRLKPRYDSETDEIVIDGPIQACRPIESVDTKVQE